MIMNDLSMIVRHMRVYAERSFAHLELGFPEQVILMLLGSGGQMNQDQISKLLDVDKGAIAKTLLKLEEKQLITRTINPENRREKLISATPSAREVMGMMHTSYAAWTESVYAGISEADIAQFKSTLSHMAQNSHDLIKGDN